MDKETRQHQGRWGMDPKRGKDGKLCWCGDCWARLSGKDRRRAFRVARRNAKRAILAEAVEVE